ncbi:hypothetical protein NDU88_001486 [Pleurodeles waltl]|uniref:Uncharacterized protein n=1 Tax=Pleurodeles waltl TaxID=8319 RepID=A0AAV7KTJ8_PLEWA|nr:hypothetical protein NDU88_001486 [Pleurodeles waltl]
MFACRSIKNTTPSIKRSVENLLEFNFQVEYLPGKKHVPDDFLSILPLADRIPDDQVPVLWVKESAIDKDE